jgi:hypothetical protein
VPPPFDPCAFEVAAARVAARARPAADYSRVKVLSLAGTASVRDAIERGSWQPPIISGSSPMELSKVATPAAGFSVRRPYARGPAGAGPRLAEESQMIYVDGRRSPA